MSVKPRVFVSYSSPDQAEADAICAALETAGVPCWIAPRDLSAGTQWGAGVVQAIEACEAVVVVFSRAANGSPQAVREMEQSVARRRPLIPIRVTNDTPTDDMQYFLGVSQWFNAYAQPIETYLPGIVTAVKRVLAGERKPWTGIQRRMPQSRAVQIALAVAGAALIAVLLSTLMRPAIPYGLPQSPLAGRWKTRMPNGQGDKANCVLDVQKSGLSTFSADCPSSLAGATGNLATTRDGTFAPNLFQSGDTGTFLFQGGTANGFTGAFKIGWFGALQTRDTAFGELKWSHAGDPGGQPAHSAVNEILPPGATWPMAGVSGAAQRATAYVRGKWQPDAVLMSMDLKPGAPVGVDASFTFYSPGQQLETVFMPGSQAGAMTAPYAHQDDLSQAIPGAVLDLPEAIDRAHAAGMQGKQITEAQLEWSGGASCGTGNFAIDNAILPKCRPGRFIGVQWQIDSALNERKYVPAN